MTASLLAPRSARRALPLLCVLALLLTTAGVAAQPACPPWPYVDFTPDFSLAQGSMEVEFGPIDPADDIKGGGIPEGLRESRNELNLQPGDDVDALSDGMDQVPVGAVFACPEGVEAWHFSVSKTTVGIEEAVWDQASGPNPNGAAGDKFIVGQCAVAPPWLWGPVCLEADGPQLGLTPEPHTLASDIDALDAQLFNIVRKINRLGLFFSLAPGSPTLAAQNYTPADILFQRKPGATPNPIGLYATEGQLGLLPGDDIDALAMVDLPPLWTFNAPADVVYVSLAPGSPTLAALGASPGDVIQVGFPAFAPAPFIVVEHEVFDLQFTDDMNALSVTDPGLIHGLPIDGPFEGIGF